MKKIVLAVCLIFGGATMVSAQQADQSQPEMQYAQDQDGQQISISELPDGVTAKLESDDYSGWTIGKAYKKTDESQKHAEVYVVEMKKGTETKKVKFDKDGSELDHNRDEMNDNQGQPHDQGQLEEQKEDQQ